MLLSRALCCLHVHADGFVLTLQPQAAGNEFGRLDAAYGGVFIGMSFLWGRVFDKMQLDCGDLIGSVLCLAGVVVILAWPRGDAAVCRKAANASLSAPAALAVQMPVLNDTLACNESAVAAAMAAADVNQTRL